jgi:glycosyltransferase involved in cell wall biosynthesis
VYNYWTYSGATEQAVKLSRSTYVKHKVNNFFFNFSNNNNFIFKKVKDQGFWVYDLPSNPFFKIINLFYLCLVISPSAFHSHGFHRLPIIAVSFFRRPILFKCTLIGRDDLPSLLDAKFGLLSKFILRRISMVNCLNEVIKELNSRYLPANKLCTIPNGVDLPEMVIKERSKFLYAGAIVPRKRPLEVIRFYNKYYAGQNFKLYLAGPFDESLGEFDPDYFLECMSEINKNPSEILLLGNISSSELASLYTTSLALIFFSLREGTPNVVLESISHNCPVIFCETDVVVASVLGPDLASKLSISNTFDTCISLNVLNNLVNGFELHEQAKLSSIENVAAMHFDLYTKLIKG